MINPEKLGKPYEKEQCGGSHPTAIINTHGVSFINAAILSMNR